MTSPGADPKAAPVAGSAGRGVILIAGAKIYFILVGFFIQVGLISLLSRVAYGAFGVVSQFVSPVNNVMVTGTIQAVSRFTAQTPERARLVQDAGLRMHLWVGLSVAVLFMAASPLIAWFQLDASKTVPLMVAGLVVAAYSFYAVMVGTANGLRQFHKQAGLDIGFATLRMFGLVGMAALGFGVTGLFAGWAMAAATILVIATAWVGWPRLAPGTTRLPTRPIAQYLIAISVYLVLFNLLMFVDGWFLKRQMTVHFQESRQTLGGALDQVLPWARQVSGFRYNPSQLADVQVAYYNAVQLLARLSYQVIVAGTFVVFPLVSRTTFEGDRGTTRQYIHVTMRYALVFALAIGVVLAANPTTLLDIPYDHDYALLGGPALGVLALGNVAFALFAIAGTVLNGAGLTRAAIAIAAVTLALAGAGNAIAIPMCRPGSEVLVVTAAVTSSAMLFGALLGGGVLARHLGAFLPLVSAVRIVGAAAVAILVGRVLDLGGGLATLVESAGVGLLFLALLVVTGELGRRDFAAIRSIRKNRAPGGES